jgi:hypothetical protein
MDGALVVALAAYPWDVPLQAVIFVHPAHVHNLMACLAIHSVGIFDAIGLIQGLLQAVREVEVVEAGGIERAGGKDQPPQEKEETEADRTDHHVSGTAVKQKHAVAEKNPHESPQAVKLCENIHDREGVDQGQQKGRQFLTCRPIQHPAGGIVLKFSIYASTPWLTSAAI